MSLKKILEDQIAWSLATFGQGKRTEGILRHIESELEEIRENPDDLSEYVDVIILALDAYWRRGGTPDDIESDILQKQRINRSRTYHVTAEDEPSEHVREEEETCVAYASCYNCKNHLPSEEVAIYCADCVSGYEKLPPSHWEKQPTKKKAQ